MEEIRYTRLRGMMVEGHNYKADGSRREWHAAKLTGKFRIGKGGNRQVEMHDPVGDPQHPRKWLNIETFTGTITEIIDGKPYVIKLVEGRRPDGQEVFNV
jgi:hypothetical protein